ncbi:17923_t:CDS:2, partial [Cetraspora pellucida]
MKRLIFAVLLEIFFFTISILSAPVTFHCPCKQNPCEVCKIDWTVEESSCDLDGCGERPVIIVRGTHSALDCTKFPGPTVYAKPNQNIQVLVRNNLSEPTTIHWHGLLMGGTPFSDGVPAINECPIQPGVSFVYDFRANNESGTYWYHSHFKPQRMDGLYGSLIINETDPNYMNYEEHNILISDWYHEKAEILLAEYQNTASNYPYNNVNAEPVPYSVLINGEGKGNCAKNCNSTNPCDPSKENCTGPCRNSCSPSCEVNLCCTSADTGVVYDLSKGGNHRFRITNAG